MSSEEQEKEMPASPSDTVLFSLRLWHVPAGDKSEWRGRILLVQTGHVRYFRTWEMLIAHLSEMLLYIQGRSR